MERSSYPHVASRRRSSRRTEFDIRCFPKYPTAKQNIFGKTEPTDVLAFPIDSFDVSTTDTPLLLGDVVICPEMAMENAKHKIKHSKKK